LDEKQGADVKGLSINAAPIDAGVTSFVQEAHVEVDALCCDTKTSFTPSTDMQDLTKYFSRPVGVLSGSLTTAVRARQFTLDFTNTETVFGFFKNGLARLTGVFGVRYTMVFTLQIAATPFHQGVLALAWQYGSLSTYNVKTGFVRTIDPATITNLPHVRLDLSVDTMVQLRVPFLSNVEYANLSTAVSNNYGHLALASVLPTPLPSGAIAPAYQLYLHLEDLEFFGAMPQSTTTLVLQAGGIQKEFEQEAYPFSSATHALSRVTKYVSAGVPMLSPLLKPTSWFLEKAAGAIRSFGFSKPQILEPVQRVFAQQNIGEFNVDVPSATMTVGPVAANTLLPTPEMGGVDVDEMALSFVLSKPSQITEFAILAAATAGTLMYAAPISPAYFWFRQSTAAPFCQTLPRQISSLNRNAFVPSTLFAVSQLFKYWRGGVRFRFTFSKTKLHGGRVMVTYTPGPVRLSDDNIGAAFPTVNINAYSNAATGPDPFGYSAVFNLKDGNVFEFTVPYMSSQHWTGFTSYNGVLTMHVVDPLQYSSMISSAIHCMVEVAADSDFELADPRTPLYTTQPNPTLLFQSGALGSVPPKASLVTTGEAINSLRQLIKIPKFTPWITSGASAITGIIPPWFISPLPIETAVAPTGNLPEAFAIGGYIAKMYAFVAGGTDFHAYISNEGTTGPVYASIAQESTMGYIPQVSPVPYQGNSSNNCRLLDATDGVIHARLPAYQRYVRYASTCLDAAQGGFAAPSSWSLNFTPPSINGAGFPEAIYSVSIRSNTAQSVLTSRAAADDAYAACWLGPIPLLLLLNTAGTVYDVDAPTSLFP
jgi:hypothetical protein